MRSARYGRIVLSLAAVVLIWSQGATAQTFRVDDPVIRQMWTEGMEQSQVESLAQILTDYIGPRLAGSPNLDAAGDWALGKFREWGVPARKEEYGTWEAWQFGITHVDLIAPRVHTLEAHVLAWSPGTDGPMEGDVLIVPEFSSEAEAARWLPSVAGKIVLVSPPEPMCRAPHELETNTTPEIVERLAQRRAALQQSYGERLTRFGGRGAPQQFADAGAAGIISSTWSGGWGVNKVFSASTRDIPSVDLSCEDYGLLFRMAENDQAPRVRMNIEAENLGEAPQFNVLAELRGTELPDEYVLLGAHLDSWHSATGATDNGTGSVMMMEAMRILKAAYPNPRRTILVGLWGPEEMGLIGSGAFREDHPEVVEGLQAAFNQDNGTWRIQRIEAQGLLYAGEHIARWVSAVPDEIAQHITLEFPGGQNNTGSDHVSFLCTGAPAFRLQSAYDEYRQYTWHTNRDTYDKISFDDLRANATLAAMLAYGASEDPERVPRDRAILPIDPRTGEPRAWVRCSTPRRSSGGE
jgi:carboxypeptidase Q